MYENVSFELWKESTFFWKEFKNMTSPSTSNPYIWHMLTLHRKTATSMNLHSLNGIFVWLPPSPSDNHKIQEIPPPILWPNEFLAKSIDSQEEPQVEFLSSVPLPEMLLVRSCIWRMKWVSPTSLETFGIHQVKTSLEDASGTTVWCTCIILNIHTKSQQNTTKRTRTSLWNGC